MNIVLGAVATFLSSLALLLIGFLHSRSVSHGETQSDHNARIENLEDSFIRIEAKLDRLIETKR